MYITYDILLIQANVLKLLFRGAGKLKRRWKTIVHYADKKAHLIFVAPAGIFLLLFSVAPLLYSFGISLTNYNLYFAQSEAKFVGLKNYVKIIQDEAFRQAVGWTFTFAVAVVVLDVALGMLLAQILTSRIFERRAGILKTIMIIPMMIAPTVIGTIWGLMFTPNYGVINWTTTVVPAKLAIIFVEMWGSIPFCLLIFMGALKTVPQELYEAALIDGAKKVTIFFRITIPHIRNFIAMVVTVRVMDSLRAFDVIYTLTSGGPGTSTETIGTTIYKTAITYSKVGQGSAGAFLFLIVIAAISFALMRILERRDDEV